MAHRIGSLVVVGMLGVVAFGCGAGPGIGGNRPPFLRRALVSLEGTVFESEAPYGHLIDSATVTILDGANAGRTATTNDIGRYEFQGLTQGGANFSVTAPGYLEARAGGVINGENRADFVLQPAP